MILMNKEDLEKYILEQNLSYAEIGRIYHCSGANVKKRAKKYGIDLSYRRNINENEHFNKGKTLSLNKKNTCPLCGGYKYQTSKKYPVCQEISGMIDG